MINNLCLKKCNASNNIHYIWNIVLYLRIKIDKIFNNDLIYNNVNTLHFLHECCMYRQLLCSRTTASTTNLNNHLKYIKNILLRWTATRIQDVWNPHPLSQMQACGWQHAPPNLLKTKKKGYQYKRLCQEKQSCGRLIHWSSETT